MTDNKAFIIDGDTIFENHISVTENEDDYPFEFSRTNMWNQSFFTPENHSDNSIEMLHNDLDEIKKLIGDIKEIIRDTFETDKKADREL